MPKPHEIRVIEEKEQLKDKLDKLIKFLQPGKPEGIDDNAWSLLNEQADAMNWYYTILTERIKSFER